MKNFLSLMFAVLLLAFTSCSSNPDNAASTDSVSTETSNVSYTSQVVPGNYVDLNSGKTVYIIQDPETGYAMDSVSRSHVDLYINTTTRDTIYRTGVVVNNSLIKSPEGTWTLSPDAKVKIDDGEMKIKEGDNKMKVDGDDAKMKTGDSKIKVDDGEVKTKP